MQAMEIKASSTGESDETLQLRPKHRKALIAGGLVCLLSLVVYVSLQRSDEESSPTLGSLGVPTANPTPSTVPLNAASAQPSVSTVVLPESCTESWPRGVQERAVARCGFWLDEVQKWGNKLQAAASRGEPAGHVSYFCPSHQGNTAKHGGEEADCHGIGDRFAGIHTVFHIALAFNKTVKVDWKYLDRIFVPSCVFPESSSWVVPTSKHANMAHADDAGGCKTHAYPFGGRKWHRTAGRIRTCMAPGNSITVQAPYKAYGSSPRVVTSIANVTLNFVDSCSSVRAYNGDGGDVGYDQMAGCPQRLLMTPGPELLGSVVPLFADGSVTKMSVRDAIAYMSQFYVVAIQMRVYMTELPRDPKGNTAKLEEQLHKKAIPESLDPFRIFRCATSVGDELKKAGKTDGRQVRWLLASDNRWLRAEAKKRYPNEIILVDEAPEHISKVDIGVDQLAAEMEAFTEWYLLSLADEAIFNRIHGDHPLWGPNDDGTGKPGRLSAFAASLWAYSLREEYVNAGDCARTRLPFDGAFGKMSGCRKDNET